MNRIYTEYYRSRGYDFDITSTTQYDQKFILNRDIFENISQIVDNIFNDYVVKQGTVQPYLRSTATARPRHARGFRSGAR